jgi:SAM-dependent methyltransferase
LSLPAARLRPGEEEISSRLARYVLFDQVNRDYLRWQVDQFEPYIGRRVLEVGVGIGTIIEMLGARDLVHGLDVEEEVMAHTRARFAHLPGYAFEIQDVTTIGAETMARLRQQRFDSVLCINVLEHIEDHVKALENMYEVLAPGGHLGLLVPAHMALYGEYDALDGHYRRYDRASLRAAIASTRFHVRDMYYFNAVGAAGWFVQYRLLRRQIHGGGQFSLMNRVLPLVRGVESRLRPPFGLSLIAVCRKPG